MAIPTSTGAAITSGTATSTGSLDMTGLTIAVGDIFVVRVSQTSTTNRTLTCSGGGLTWTTQQTAQNTVCSYIATAVATSTTPFTITLTFSGTSTYVARVNVINDVDGGAAVDVSDKFTQTATSCFAAGVSGITTAANCIVLVAFACGTGRTWTKGAAYTVDATEGGQAGQGAGYLFQFRSSATALTAERPDATQSSTAQVSAATCISIKGAASGGGGMTYRRRRAGSTLWRM